MSWKSALFSPGRMDEKTTFFLSEARMAHDRITNLLILTYPLLAGAWQFRETAKHFAPLSNPIKVRDAVLSYMRFPVTETAVRRLDFNESVTNISWERQRDSTAEMMFIVFCSIFENFTSHLQDLLLPAASHRHIEKGFQFPAVDYDLTQDPPTPKATSYSDNVQRALKYLPKCPFMTSHLCPTFPIRNGRNVVEDLEAKLQTYLLFKKLRNSISHGRFDTDIPRQHEIVSKMVNNQQQGTKNKISISSDSSGNYFVTLYDIVGFSALLLNIIRDIDFLYLISEHGNNEVMRRLASTKDSKQLSPKDRQKEFTRLKSCLQGIGVNNFIVNNSAREEFIRRGSWRP